MNEFGASEHELLRAEVIHDSLVSYLRDGESSTENRFRPHQASVFQDLADFITQPPEDEFGTRSGVVKLPTGTGKTVVFAKVVDALHKGPSDLGVLILVPTKEILHQTVGSDQTRGLGRFAIDAAVGTYFQDNKDLNKPITVMTYASFNTVRKSGELPDDFCDVIICDEGHHTLGPVTEQNITKFMRGKLALAFTATPDYGDDKHLNRIFKTTIHEMDIREAIETGLSAPFQYLAYKTNYKIDIDIYEKSHFTPQELERLASIEARNKTGVAFAKSLVEQGMGVLVSCLPGENVLHAKVIAEMLNREVVKTKNGTRQIKASRIDGSMEYEERKAIYEKFERKEIDVLTFVDVIKEGWDSNRAKGLINLRPTCSPVFSNQRRGRIMRLTENRELAVEVDFIDETQKRQYTALHALGEYKYCRDKIFGPKPPEAYGTGVLVNLPDELKEGVSVLDSKKVSDILLNPNYIAVHSERIPLKTVATILGLPADVMLPLAAYLRLEVYDFRELHAKKGTLHISEKDIEKLAQVTRTEQFRWLQESTNLKDRNGFYNSLLEGRAKNDRKLLKTVIITDSQTDVIKEPNIDRYEQLLIDESQFREWTEEMKGRLAEGGKLNPGDVQKTVWLLSKGKQIDPEMTEIIQNAIVDETLGYYNQILSFCDRRSVVKSIGHSNYGKFPDYRRSRYYIKLSRVHNRIVIGAKHEREHTEAQRQAARSAVRFLIKHFQQNLDTTDNA
ncbi:MAG: hypothetical protein NVSMB46_05410 [Candidatus Saccharimonadales bacterium]